MGMVGLGDLQRGFDHGLRFTEWDRFIPPDWTVSQWPTMRASKCEYCGTRPEKPGNCVNCGAPKR